MCVSEASTIYVYSWLLYMDNYQASKLVKLQFIKQHHMYTFVLKQNKTENFKLRIHSFSRAYLIFPLLLLLLLFFGFVALCFSFFLFKVRLRKQTNMISLLTLIHHNHHHRSLTAIIRERERERDPTCIEIINRLIRFYVVWD